MLTLNSSEFLLDIEITALNIKIMFESKLLKSRFLGRRLAVIITIAICGCSFPLAFEEHIQAAVSRRFVTEQATCACVYIYIYIYTYIDR